MLLVGAGLLIRSFVRLQQVSPSFNPDHVISMRLGAGNHHFQGNAAAIQFYRQVSEKIAAVPGVKAQGSCRTSPSHPPSAGGKSTREASRRSPVRSCKSTCAVPHLTISGPWGFLC